MSLLHVTKDNFNELKNSTKPVLLDFYADWCGPCKMLAPVIHELENEYTDVKFCKVNVDEEGELADAFKVTSIPMVAFVKNNTFVDVSVGYVPKEKLAKLIEEHK